MNLEYYDEFLYCLYKMADKASEIEAFDVAERLLRECLVIIRKSYDDFSLHVAIASQRLAYTLLTSSKTTKGSYFLSNA